MRLANCAEMIVRLLKSLRADKAMLMNYLYFKNDGLMLKKPYKFHLNKNICKDLKFKNSENPTLSVEIKHL